MSTQVGNTSSTRAGLCPHGLPPAACPICSGQMSGGAGKKNESIKPKSNGEWSYMKCYAEGLRLKSLAYRAEFSKTALKKQGEYLKELTKNINNLAERIKSAIANIQNTLPPIFNIPVQIISNIIIFPILNIILQIPKLTEKFIQTIQFIQNFISQVIEKLVTIFGEIKNFINSKLKENIKKITKNIFSFFISNAEDENYKNDDTLAVFKSRELKKFIVKIFKKEKRKNNAD